MRCDIKIINYVIDKCNLLGTMLPKSNKSQKFPMIGRNHKKVKITKMSIAIHTCILGRTPVSLQLNIPKSAFNRWKVLLKKRLLTGLIFELHIIEHPFDQWGRYLDVSF